MTDTSVTIGYIGERLQPWINRINDEALSAGTPMLNAAISVNPRDSMSAAHCTHLIAEFFSRTPVLGYGYGRPSRGMRKHIRAMKARRRA